VRVRKPPTPSTKLSANYVQLIVWVGEALWRRAWRSSHGFGVTQDSHANKGRFHRSLERTWYMVVGF
jgi:hypothetical protein